MRYLILLLALTGCASPELENNPYQTRAAELVALYNSHHGTSVPIPPVHIGSSNSIEGLQEGDAYCPPHANGCWLTIDVAFDTQRHGPDYAMQNTLPHEVAHHICIYLKKCPRGNYHGQEWQEIARELGLSQDSYLKG